MKIILAGATGFIGTTLVEKLAERGHTLFILTRNAQKAQIQFGARATALAWDGKSSGKWIHEVNGADVVINLAGENLSGKRWTKEFKDRCWNSRVDASRAISEAILNSDKKPHVLIQASAVGFYGSVPDGIADESRAPSNDYLGQLCSAWERAAAGVEQAGIRTVWLRIGIVLEKDGGALAKMVTPFRLFVGGPLGSGRQFFPWIHRDDVIGSILFALDQPLHGAYNLASPGVVTMKAFSKSLGNILHRPSWAPVPEFVLRIVVGEFAIALVNGQNARPDKLIRDGYEFVFPELRLALNDIIRK